MADASDFFELVAPYRDEIIHDTYLEEIAFIASLTDFSPDDVLKANAYYDVLKAYWGCTAFAIAHQGRVFHARNLDWWTENHLLSRHTIVFDFQREGKTLFKSVGWPDFIGVLSGIKPNAFSVTMNAVISHDSPEIATPIGFMLRDVLTESTCYADAKQQLERTTIASDALILLSGTHVDALAVIERTPTRFATRKAENGFIVVTNDYKMLESQGHNVIGESPLQETSCARFDHVCMLLSNHRPTQVAACLHVLQPVTTDITVQQMVFENVHGELAVFTTE